MKTYLELLKSLCMLMLMTLALESCAATQGNKYPLDPAYARPKTIDSEMQLLASNPSGIAKLHLLGFSGTNDLPIRALEIGSPTASRNVLIVGQHHGDEVMGVQLALEFARQLVSSYQKSNDVNNILGQFRFWIVPTINPEGYQEVIAGNYQWKRKNNTDTDHNGFIDIRVDGVDLNRNYPTFWDLDTVIQPDNQNYRGAKAASESEIQAILNLADHVPMEFAIFYHSSATGIHSEKIFLPWHDVQDSKQTAAIERLHRFADSYAALVPKDYKSGNYEVHANALSKVGNARNHFFHRYGTMAMLVEIGGINRFGTSIVHPEKKMLQQNITKNINALLKVFQDNMDVATE